MIGLDLPLVEKAAIMAIEEKDDDCNEDQLSKGIKLLLNISNHLDSDDDDDDDKWWMMNEMDWRINKIDLPFGFVVSLQLISA